MELNVNKSLWVKVQFGDVVQKVSNKIDPETYHSEIVIQGGHINKRDFHIREYEHKNELGYLGPAFHMGFKKRQILYVSRNPHLMKVGYPQFDGICANTTFIMETKDESVLRNDLVPFIMHSDTFIEQSVANVRGGVNPYVNWSDLACIELLLPPKDQQAQLAKLLWAMDEVIERELLLSNKLKTFYNVGIEELLEGKSLLKKENGKYSILKDNSVRDKWENISIGELCNKVTDGEHLSPVFLEEGKPILSAKDIRENDVQIENSKFISEEAFITSRKRCDPDFNDVLIVSRGATIGRTTVNKLKQPFALMGSVILLKPNDKILGDYLGMLIRRNRYQRRLLAISGSTAQQAIYLVDIKKSKVDIPNVEYQNLIVEFMTDISNRLMQAKEKISTSKSLQKSLINQIF